MTRLGTLFLAPALLATLLVGGCTGGDDGADPAPSPSETVSREPVAPPAPPKAGACIRLEFDDLLQATSEREPVPCSSKHTTRTVLVGDLNTVVDGHLAAVDSKTARAKPPSVCARAVDAYLGGTVEQRRLSMISTAWFGPTVEASDAGEQWFRCDVVAVAAPETLEPLPKGLKGLKGILDDESARNRFAMCGTARPGTRAFERVICDRKHSWRASGTVQVPAAKGGAWPGKAAAERAGGERCKELARRGADDALNYEWGYEWPTREQWQAGRRYGVCWAPA